MEPPSGNVYAPCPCGSGKKYKFCCRDRDREKDREMRSGPREVVVTGPDGAPMFVPEIVGAALAFEQARDAFDEGRYRETLGHFERVARMLPGEAAPLNSMALIRFMLGDVEEAVAILERVEKEVDPRDLHTLSGLVHFYILLGRQEDAEAIQDRLQSVRPGTPEALQAKCEALARFGDHEAILREVDAGGDLPRGAPIVSFFAGMAAANLGRHEEARRHLHRTLREPTSHPRGPDYATKARASLALLEMGEGPGTIEGDWPYFDGIDWVCPGLLNRLGDKETARPYPGIAEGFLAMLQDDPDDADAVLDGLVVLGTPRAREILRKIAFGTFGSDDLRLDAVDALVELEEVARGEPLRIWLEGRWQEHRPTRVVLTDDAPLPIPEEHTDAMKEILQALEEEDWARTIRLGEALIERGPDSPVVHDFVGSALLRLGRSDEAEAHLRRAIDIDPTYLFPRSTLTAHLLRQDRLEEAREIVDTTTLPSRVHPGAFLSDLVAQTLLAIHEGDEDGIHATMGSIAEMAGEADALEPASRELARAAARAFARFQVQRSQGGDVSPRALVEALESQDVSRLRGESFRSTPAG